VANQLYRFSMTLVDEDGVKANVSQYAKIPEATTGTNLQVTLGDWATAVSNLSDGGVLRTDASLVVEPSVFTLSPTPSGDEEVSETGNFQYNLVGSPFTSTTVIPALIEAAEAGVKIDLTNASVIAYNTLLTSALFTTGYFTNPDGLELDTRKASFLGNRKHRRQLHQKSYELG
jgi:hypothetical protein